MTTLTSSDKAKTMTGPAEAKKNRFIMTEGNEAAAHIAYQTSEVIAIYPITPSSNMGEWADQWASERKPNLWGTVPSVIEMQSEGGAAGAIHGALQTGALATTFTASQGLLLMIPNMYKIAGELTPTVFHVSARSLACQALSIFGDHSDVMSARSTGFVFLCSSSVQEVMDLALVAHAASLKSRLPFLHFFDGFRTSHEVSKVEMVSTETIREMIDDKLVAEHRQRALTPDHPVIRGTAQNPDVYFQGRETVNRFYDVCPNIVQEMMDKFAKLTGRSYKLFEYFGAPDAERVIVLMGSGCEVVHETVDYLKNKGEKVGVLKVKLYRPFDGRRFFETLPASVKSIAVLDRTKEPGSTGEPLYLDCLKAISDGLAAGWAGLKSNPKMIGGRYGLSSKEFTPAMVKGVFDHLKNSSLKDHFTIGINDDVTHTSLPFDPSFSIEQSDTVRAIFYGLGSDGTVGANKNSIKIIGMNTDNYAQGYFVYDSRKAGAVTVSHLRFGKRPIRLPYLVTEANFVGCHQWGFLDRYEMLKFIVPGGTFLVNTVFDAKTVWNELSKEVQAELIKKKPKFYVIDAYKVAKDTGMGNRINTIMQVCFFALSNILPKEKAIAEIKKAIEKTYGKKGEEVVKQNLAAVDQALAHLQEVVIPGQVTSQMSKPPAVPAGAPPFVEHVLGEIIAGHGDNLPVSAMPVDGTFPTDTSNWEGRNLAQEIPVWDPATCIQCGKCNFVCPHSVIRAKTYDPKILEKAPAAFKSVDARDPERKGLKYTLQIAEEYCTGCGLCVSACPAKNKTDATLKAINMRPERPLREQEKANWKFFKSIPDIEKSKLKISGIRQQQLLKPLFEFSSSCAGCGETPYLRLMSQLFGDRAVIANATGCSSIYGGNLPSTPWSKDAHGRGPAWSNSLFEDNAEFGLGFRLSIDKQKEFAMELVKKLAGSIGDDLATALITTTQKTEADIYEQRQRVEVLKAKLKDNISPEALVLMNVADMLVKKSVWIVGGDGWAYDIGYGGLDHVLASGRDVNLLVLDTEVYSNTGGQASKATPRGAVAKFASDGKPAEKKDLGLMAISYSTVYVASVAMGAKDEHTLKAFMEAEAYDGPSLIIAYCHCIAHGIDMGLGLQHQKAVVQTGRWPLYRYNPDKSKTGENPFTLEPVTKKMPLVDYMNSENRFRMIAKSKPEEAKKLWQKAQEEVNERQALYEFLASLKAKKQEPPAA